MKHFFIRKYFYTRAHKKPNKTQCYEQIPADFQFIFPEDNFWTSWEVQSDAQTMVLLNEKYPCLRPHPTQWGSWMMLLLPSSLSWRVLVKEDYIPGPKTAYFSNWSIF